MFKDQLIAAVEGARGGKALDDVSRLIWRGVSQGVLDDDDAQMFAELIHAKREAVKERREATRPRSIFPPRRVQRAPDRAVARARRRELSLNSTMPHRIAIQFTEGERAILAIVASEVRAHGACTATLAEIAARAGTCRKLAQTTMRLAERLELITIEERPQTGAKNLPNVVRIVCREWRSWLEKRPPRSTGGKRVAPTEDNSIREGRNRPEPSGYTRHQTGRSRWNASRRE